MTLRQISIFFWIDIFVADKQDGWIGQSRFVFNVLKKIRKIESFPVLGETFGLNVLSIGEHEVSQAEIHRF